MSKQHICIIMRTFWPVSPVVGDGMLRVVDELSKSFTCSVITQNQENIYHSLEASGRGRKIQIYAFKALSSSSSKIFTRLIDLIWFTVATSYSLLTMRPKIIYVATDPPILVPAIVSIYCKGFSAKYLYHIQDIHPEGSAVAYPQIKGPIFRTLRWVDAKVVSNANLIITLTDEMLKSLFLRNHPIPENQFLLNNPAADFKKKNLKQPLFDYCFVGNAGRLQRIPLLVDAIDSHLKCGGNKKFIFAGAGVMAEKIERLANKHPDHVSFLGKLSAFEASKVIQNSKKALLPIDDEICKFAFPSKASSYVKLGKPLVGICGKNTSVGVWINKFHLGHLVSPDIVSLREFFDTDDCEINDKIKISGYSKIAPPKLDRELDIKYFTTTMTEIIVSMTRSG